MKKVITLALAIILVTINTKDISGNKIVTSAKEYTYSNTIEVEIPTEIEHETIEDTNITIDDKIYGYIFIGDSRFVGMNTYYNIEDIPNNYVIAEVGEGYDYLINRALPKADNIMQSNTEVDDWKLIICLGINDLGNIENYISTYSKLAKQYNIIIISVNPIEYHNSITNITVEMFNYNIKSIDGITYIDTYTELMTNGFSTVDGIHYTKETYGDILNTINKYK